MEEIRNSQLETNSYEVETNSLSFNDVSLFNQNSNSASFEEIKSYIKYPMIYNKILRTISKQAYNANGLYGQSIDRMIALPTLSYITTLRNRIDKMKNIKSKFKFILKLLNIERTTRDILRSLFIEGMYVGILRETSASNKNIDTSLGMIESLDRLEGLSLDDNFMIQPLDLDYCKIIGFQNNISIAAFDMMYFDQFKHGGLINEIKNYPIEFIKAYKEYRKDSSKRWYILDYKKTIALKAKASELDAYGTPFGISAFADIRMDDEYENSQYKLIQELASSIYFLVLPEGEKKGTCSLNKDQQQNIIDAFKNAVKINTNNTGGAKISTLSLAPGTTIDRLSKDASLLKDTLSNENAKKISANLGFAISALNAESEHANLGSLQISLDLISAQIFQYINEIAKEQTRVVNEHLNIKPRDYIDIKYLPITWLNKDDAFDKAEKLYMQGKGSFKYWVATMGVDVDDYMNLMDEELEEDIENKYPVHKSSYTISDSADKPNPEGNVGGRPLKKQKDLTNSGLQTRNRKSNEQKPE